MNVAFFSFSFKTCEGNVNFLLLLLKKCNYFPKSDYELHDSD